MEMAWHPVQCSQALAVTSACNENVNKIFLIKDAFYIVNFWIRGSKIPTQNSFRTTLNAFIHGMQWSLGKTGTMGCNAGEPSGNCCLAPSTRGSCVGYHSTEKCWDCICRLLQSSAFWPEMVHNAVHNALSNILTMGTPFPSVPAAFQQWELRSLAFPLRNDHTGWQWTCIVLHQCNNVNLYVRLSIVVRGILCQSKCTVCK